VREQKEEQNDWRQKVTWSTSLDKTKQKILEANSGLAAKRVGHLAVEQGVHKKISSIDLVKDYKTALKTL
jgi:hypothetical protein